MIQERRVGEAVLAIASPAELDAPEVRAAALADLTTTERTRLETLTDSRADDLLLGRHLLRSLVRRLVPAETTTVVVTATCARCGGPHGRPVVVGHGVLASIAHASGMVVAAIAPTASVAALGVDVEPLDGTPADATTRAWTRYEATLKAEGSGVVAHRGELDPAALAALTAALPRPYEVRELTVGHHALAVALALEPPLAPPARTRTRTSARISTRTRPLTR